ncbi:hypothetical protein FHEFKHOI_00126 [Candidatus Methanoperedenaceae archaeon GB50]|nr:hypothetical protein FHEFKHOI_00126 [Candidatus Methanoperedenaceae archaeon GB50]
MPTHPAPAKLSSADRTGKPHKAGFNKINITRNTLGNSTLRHHNQPPKNTLTIKEAFAGKELIALASEFSK